MNSTQPGVEEQSADPNPQLAANDTAPSGAILNVSFIGTWMAQEGWTNKTLAEKLLTSERTVSSLRNNGNYHGVDAVTKLANLMNCDPEDLYLHEASS